METSIMSRFRKAWNVFVNNRDPTYWRSDLGYSYSHRPDRPRFTRGNERSIVTAIYNRIALDVSAITFQHAQLDGEGRFLKVIDSGLNNCLNVEANIDQSGRAFIQDVVMSMFDEGVIAMVPVDTDVNLKETDSYDILTMRVGKILEWYPAHVKLQVYNDRIGKKEEIVLPKRKVAIIENPFYAVMNEPSSTLQRLIRKLNLLDMVDEQSGSGKLDLIIQLPYVIKSEARRQQAEARRKDIEMQLSGSKYGIAYTDGTERVTQLNRPVENNLLKQIEYLTNVLYSQLGITQGVLDGTADEKTMQNYYTRTVKPVVAAIIDAIKRTFLTKTARTQGKTIMYFRDPFELASLSELTEILGMLTRNGLFSQNEGRHVLGRKPSDDPEADKLVNSNIKQPNPAAEPSGEVTNETIEEGEIQNGSE